MIVQNVEMSNIDKLYEAIAIGKHNPDYDQKIYDNINRLLSHVTITFFIDDLTLFEEFIIKVFTNSEIIPVATFYDNEALGDKYKQVIDNILTLSNSINHDADIKYSIGQYFLTAGCITKRIILSLSGSQLFSIFSMMPDIFFMKTFGYQSNSDFSPEILDYKVLENSLITNFVNNFYNYYQSYVNKIDTVVDSYIHNNFYSFIDDKKTSVSLSDVVSPTGSISFFGDKTDNIQTGISHTSSVFLDVIDDVRGLMYKSINLYFVINCSFYAFLEMFVALPNTFFIDHQDMKLLFREDAKMIIPEGLDKYSMRLSSKLGDIKKMKDEVSSKPEANLTRYKFIPLNTSIKFSMKISLNDISSTLLKYETAIRNSHIYNMNSALSNEILYIINSIKSTSKSIYDVLLSSSKELERRVLDDNN